MVSPERAHPFSGNSTSTWTPQSSDLKFVDEKFEVIPAPAKLPPPSSEGAESGSAPTSGPGFAPGPDFTEEELLDLTVTFWGIPNIFFDKLPERNPGKLKNWNHQFYRYCVKKGINPWEWFFDELPLALATIGLAGGVWRDYKETYRNKETEKEKSREDKKLSADFDHEKQVAEQKEKDIKSGAISSAPAAPAQAPAGG